METNKEDLVFISKCHIASQSFLAGAWLVSISERASLLDITYLTCAMAVVAGITYCSFNTEAKRYK